jgi:HlyD family secretion protein
VEHVTAQQQDAQEAYLAAEDVLHKSNIVAPFDGVVYVLPVKQGGYVQAGELLLQEADLSKVLVRAYVDEPDIGRLVPGQKTEVTWDALPGRIWTGAVIVLAQHDNVLTLPREALRLDDSKPYVYEIVDNKLKRRDVAVAASNLTSVEISGGLSDKTKVALSTTAANKSLRDGIPVKVVQ